MLSSLLLSSVVVATPVSDAPRGLYVEARTAAVYAGACHYGSQYTTQGRAALVGFAIEGGEHGGVSLAGVELAVAVAADRNLVQAGGKERRSLVWIDEAASARVREAALAWIRSEHAALLGKVIDVRVARLEIGRDGDSFRMQVGKQAVLTGAALPDRECCKMPFNVWYEPLVAVRGRLVGRADTFRFQDERLGRRWSRPDENSVFFGRFGPRGAR